MSSKLCLTVLFITCLAMDVRPVHALDFIVNGSHWEVEDAEGSWGLGIGAALPLLTEYIRLEGRATFFESSDFSNDELDLIPLDLGVQLHLLPGEKFDPYLLGGLSYIYADADRIDVDSELGGYLGLGLDFGIWSIIKPFGEIIYRGAELDSDHLGGQDIEVSGVTANLGIKVHF